VNGSILHDLEGKAKLQAQYFHVVCLHSLSIYPSYLGVNVLFSKRNQANTSLFCGSKNIKVMYLCHALKVLDCWCMNPESGQIIKIPQLSACLDCARIHGLINKRLKLYCASQDF